MPKYSNQIRSFARQNNPRTAHARHIDGERLQHLVRRTRVGFRAQTCESLRRAERYVRCGNLSSDCIAQSGDSDDRSKAARSGKHCRHLWIMGFPFDSRPHICDSGRRSLLRKSDRSSCLVLRPPRYGCGSTELFGLAVRENLSGDRAMHAIDTTNRRAEREIAADSETAMRQRRASRSNGELYGKRNYGLYRADATRRRVTLFRDNRFYRSRPRRGGGANYVFITRCLATNPYEHL